MAKYEYTEDMGEISGFGGPYEEACRKMVIAGLEFWDEQGDDFDPNYKGLKGVYGVMLDDNEDAKKLDEGMMRPLTEQEMPTGAMHQACVQHIFAARRLGWPEYQKQMRERPEE